MMRAVLVSTLRDLRRSWRRMLVAYLGFKLVAFAVLFPLAGLTLQAFLAASGQAAVSDKEILLFALSPVGALGLFAAAIAAVGILALEQACLMAIGFAGASGRRVGLAEVFAFTRRRFGPVLLVTAQAVGRALLMTAPFLALAVFIYVRWLGEFDINYYLSERPPEFRTAALLVGGVLLAMVLVVGPRVIGWVLALPLVLLEDTSVWRALAVSRARTRDHRKQIAGLLLLWFGAGSLASALVGLFVRWIGSTVALGLIQQTGPLVVFLGGLVIFWAMTGLAIALFNAASLAMLSCHLYRLLGGAAEARVLEQGATESRGRPRRAWSTRNLLGGLLAAGVVSGAVGWWLLEDLDVRDDQIVVIAHRGAAGAAPENTMAAVERALLDAADQVEIDVQTTADGTIVVIHDSDLMRVAGVPLAVRDATREQLREIDIGSHFGAGFADQRVPTLEQVLRACHGCAGTVIELKYYGPDPRLAERVVDIVESVGAEGQIQIMSLEQAGLDQIRELRPSWRRGLLSAVALGKLSTSDNDFLAVRPSLATPAFLSAAHAADKDVYVWTINDLAGMAEVIRRGVDGIITDEPALARRALEQWGELDAVEHLLLRMASWFDITPEAVGVPELSGS